MVALAAKAAIVWLIASQVSDFCVMLLLKVSDAIPLWMASVMFSKPVLTVS